VDGGRRGCRCLVGSAGRPGFWWAGPGSFCRRGDRRWHRGGWSRTGGRSGFHGRRGRRLRCGRSRSRSRSGSGWRSRCRCRDRCLNRGRCWNGNRGRPGLALCPGGRCCRRRLAGGTGRSARGRLFHRRRFRGSRGRSTICPVCRVFVQQHDPHRLDLFRRRDRARTEQAGDDGRMQDECSCGCDERGAIESHLSGTCKARGCARRARQKEGFTPYALSPRSPSTSRMSNSPRSRACRKRQARSAPWA